MITLSSIFRNSTGYLDRYFAQVAALREHLPVRLVLGEGDSNDATADELRERVEPGDMIVTVNHGGQSFGSVDHPVRWANIAKVVHGLIEVMPPVGDAFVYVESDLIWDPQTILRLLEDNCCVAPMVMASDNPHRFYDVWGFREDGRMFYAHPPYLPFGECHDRMAKIDSCGNCFVVPASEYDCVAEWDGMWPFPAKGRLWLDQEQIVRHPL